MRYGCPLALVPNEYSPASGSNDDRHIRPPPLGDSNGIGQVLSSGNNAPCELLSVPACRDDSTRSHYSVSRRDPEKGLVVKGSSLRDWDETPRILNMGRQN